MSDESSSRIREYGLLVLLSVLWGASFSLIKVAVVDYPPATLVAIRMFIGGLLLTAVAFCKGLAFPRSAKRWLDLVVQGILQSALPFSLISWGEQYIPSALAGVLNSTVPMMVFVISRSSCLGGRRSRQRSWSACCWGSRGW
jgi:drug/metabolite transporter (DMT)-like permease